MQSPPPHRLQFASKSLANLDTTYKGIPLYNLPRELTKTRRAARHLAVFGLYSLTSLLPAPHVLRSPPWFQWFQRWALHSRAIAHHLGANNVMRGEEHNARGRPTGAQDLRRDARWKKRDAERPIRTGRCPAVNNVESTTFTHEPPLPAHENSRAEML